MMTRRIIVRPVEGGFELRTERGFVLGQRLYSVAPKPGSVYPRIPESPLPEHEARKLALDWNVYFAWAEQKKPKTKSRIAD